eukprot:2250764-Karenia_brevis.AAC.1
MDPPARAAFAEQLADSSVIIAGFREAVVAATAISADGDFQVYSGDGTSRESCSLRLSLQR